MVANYANDFILVGTMVLSMRFFKEFNGFIFEFNSTGDLMRVKCILFRLV